MTLPMKKRINTALFIVTKYNQLIFSAKGIWLKIKIFFLKGDNTSFPMNNTLDLRTNGMCLID